MLLVHGNAPVAERIVAAWDDYHGVAEIICIPDWKLHGKVAPFNVMMKC